MDETKVVYLPRGMGTSRPSFMERFRQTNFRRIFSLLKELLPIPAYLADYTGAFLVTVSRLIEEEKYGEALALSHQGLKRCGESTDARMRSRWWRFLSCAAYCAEMLDDAEEKERLLTQAEGSFLREKGRSVAYCFVYFSRWKYAEYEFAKAMEYAEIAREADTTFAEAHFLLGWYALFVRQADPSADFRAAVESDQAYLSRIVHDPEIAQFPHIIKKLRQLRSYTSSGRRKPQT